MSPSQSLDYYKALSYHELRSAASKLGLDSKGTKDAILTRVAKHLETQPKPKTIKENNTNDTISKTNMQGKEEKEQETNHSNNRSTIKNSKSSKQKSQLTNVNGPQKETLDNNAINGTIKPQSSPQSPSKTYTKEPNSDLANNNVNSNNNKDETNNKKKKKRRKKKKGGNDNNGAHDEGKQPNGNEMNENDADEEDENNDDIKVIIIGILFLFHPFFWSPFPYSYHYVEGEWRERGIQLSFFYFCFVYDG